MESRLRMISTVTVERIVISVLSSDLGDADDILLGVVKAVSSKGSDQVERSYDPPEGRPMDRTYTESARVL
jgi:hypothetical protein